MNSRIEYALLHQIEPTKRKRKLQVINNISTLP